jgi:hypothetical protein
MRPSADNPYKEFKIATFYDQSNDYRQVMATADDCHEVGRLVRRQAIHPGLNQFGQKLAVADGADWIYSGRAKNGAHRPDRIFGHTPQFFTYQRIIESSLRLCYYGIYSKEGRFGRV